MYREFLYVVLEDSKSCSRGSCSRQRMSAFGIAPDENTEARKCFCPHVSNKGGWTLPPLLPTSPSVAGAPVPDGSRALKLARREGVRGLPGKRGAGQRSFSTAAPKCQVCVTLATGMGSSVVGFVW